MEINDFDRQVWGRKMWLPRDVKKSHIEFGEIIQKTLNSLSQFVGGYSIMVSMPKNLKLTTARASNIGPVGFAAARSKSSDVLPARQPWQCVRGCIFVVNANVWATHANNK